MTGRMVKSQSPGRRTFCLASGGFKVQQTRPWLGLVDLSRIPKRLFFGRSILARKLPAKITKTRQNENEKLSNHDGGSSQGRHYRESLFWTVRSFESPRGACDHGRPRAAPRQINARSWERHFQRRDAIFGIALLGRLHHMSDDDELNINPPTPCQ